MSIKSVRFFSFLVFMGCNLVVAIQAPAVIGDFGLWSMAGLTALITGRSWQHIANKDKVIK